MPSMFNYCHSETQFASAVALAVAFLSVIPSGNLLLLLPLPLLFYLSFLKGICFCCCPCHCLSFCHSLGESASAVALAVAFLSVIPEGNLLLSLPLPFFLPFLKGICLCFCRCRCLSFCHSLGESACAFALVVAFLSVIPPGNLLLPLSLSLPLLFFLSFPRGIRFSSDLT